MTMKVKLSPMYDAYDFKPSTASSAGIDLRVCITTPITLNCSEELLLDTGVALEIPEGWFGLVVPRSSTGRKKIRLANTAAVIDSDYRGNIKLAVRHNALEPTPVIIEPMERLAQLIIIPHYQYQLHFVEELTDTVRGDGGFGSTGTH